MLNFFNQLNTFFTAYPGLGKLILIIIYFSLAYLVRLMSVRIVRFFFGSSHALRRRLRRTHEREEVLSSLLGGILTFFAFTIAIISTLLLFASLDTLLWMVGLFSAGLGFSARPIISDFIIGMSLIFENAFEVGDKVELPGVLGGNVEGIIEKVNLRTTLIRSPTGEPVYVPNGEIRLIKNYSRGRFSMANIRLKVATKDLNHTIDLLEQLGNEAVNLLPNLIEPWQVISESGEMGQFTELTLVAKARYGNAADMRPRMLALIQERLDEAEVELVA